MAKRWRKQPKEKGLGAVCQAPRGFELRANNEILIHVSPLMNSDRHTIGWYWYGLGCNTAKYPVATAEEAKKQAQDHIKNKGL